MHRRGRATDNDEPNDAATFVANPPTMHVDRSSEVDAQHSDRVAICICVDDFGLHEGVNRAALRLADIERVHAIGALVAAPAWRAGSRLLRQRERSAIDVGLHLDLCDAPLLAASPRSTHVLVAASFAGWIDRATVRAEICAQLDAFEDAIGDPPAFVDGHRHVHQLPGVRDELLAELSRRYGAPGPWIRHTTTPSAAVFGARSLPIRLKAATIASLGARGLADRAREHGFAQNAGLLGVYDFRGGRRRYRDLLLAWLSVARSADLLMCHAGLACSESDALRAVRPAEYDVLSSDEAGDMLSACGVALQPMSWILRAMAGVTEPPAASARTRTAPQ